MDGPPLAGSTGRALQAKGLETERISAISRRAEAGDPSRGNPGKPVGAAAKVLRTLHASKRPLKASEVGMRTTSTAARLSESMRWLRLG
jgi:hypothetical protein